MRIVLLSGGSGKRLWPLSNDVRSKQFLKLLKNKEGKPESMVQRVYRQIKEAGIECDIVVATGVKQVASIQNQLGNKVDIVLEPTRRDTFPAISLAASYLFYEKHTKSDEVIIVLPVDPYTDLGYFRTLERMIEKVENESVNMALMGVQPTYPSAKYGYIIPNEETQRVERFQEKPTKELAAELIKEKALWNGGVFAFKVGYMMDILRDYIDFNCYKDVELQYHLLPKISFDYEVVEKEATIAYVKFDGMWKDLGTWNTLTEVMDNDALGKVVLEGMSENTHVINELDIPIVVLGTKNIVVAASPDGILVSDKNESSYLKEFLKDFSGRPMCEEHRWGEYRVIDYVHYPDGSSSLTKSLIIKAGEYQDYVAHKSRDEIITVVNGRGSIVIDGDIQEINSGDTIHIRRGQKHAIRALKTLRLIEVQVGLQIIEEDAKKTEWLWL